MRKQCDQYKCHFRSMPSLCPVCAECGAPACVLDDCTNCYCCREDEGFVRQGTPKGHKAEVKIQIEQVVK